jgi:hypothetical protein
VTYCKDDFCVSVALVNFETFFHTCHNEVPNKRRA